MQMLTERDWLNVFANVMSATNFAALAVVLLTFLQRTDVGHKKLMWLNFIFSVSQTVKALSNAWDLYHGKHTLHSAILHFTCSMVESVCVVYFLVTIMDILLTLRRSEHLNQQEKDKATDIEQGGTNLSYLSARAKGESEALLVRRKTGFEGGENSDANNHSSRDIRASVGAAGYGHNASSKPFASWR
jgi:hypothetical protein